MDERPVEPTAARDGPAGQHIPAERLVQWSEALAGIARTGLGFTASRFEAERFGEVLRIAGDIRAEADECLGSEPRTCPCSSVSEGHVARWLRSVGNGIDGYVTPRVAVGAVVGDHQGRLLLVQRADSGAWLYPTGWADVGYSASEVAVKEVLEETGLEVEPVRIIMVLDGIRHGFASTPLYSIVFHCRLLGGSLVAHPLECAAVGWFAREHLPGPLAGGEHWLDQAFAAINGGPAEASFDRPRTPVWRHNPLTSTPLEGRGRRRS